MMEVKTGDRLALSGMQAAAYAAYALSDAAMIFPITPASHMAEQIEAWSVGDRKNVFGETVLIKEMQSEKGAAGAMHGCLAGGALASTFTASQGLLLMIPNMYKISGELLPGVYHVTCRSLSAHALSIFGDHQDLMAVRATGSAMLGSSSVQECMDLSLVAHLSAIQGSLPFIHFFDGFRTSDEIASIEVIAPRDMASLLDTEAVDAFRAKAMDPLHPMIRGTAQNPDIYFQNREAPNRYYDELPSIVQSNMDKVTALTGRAYKLFDYVGAPDAEHIIVTMASSCDVVEEYVRHAAAAGGKVGLVKVRLYRPFAAERLMEAIPASAKTLCALDRTKEPGSQGEPLLQDVVMAVYNSGRTDIKVTGGRYGLSSKDFDPACVKAIFDDMKSDAPHKRFTVGITDDVTNLSLPRACPEDIPRTLPKDTYQGVFYGFGSDGTVGANRQTAKLLDKLADKWVQQYSWFDSKKSGGLTISYMRFADEPIHAPYLINDANYVACHKDVYVTRGYPLAERLTEGGVFVLNSAWSVEDMERVFPDFLKRELAEKKAKFYNIDAAALAQEAGLGSKINMIMETVFLKLCGLVDFNKAVEALKEDVAKLYSSKGADVVEKNRKAIDMALSRLQKVEIPESWKTAGAEDGKTGSLLNSREIAEPDEPPTAYDPQIPYIKNIFWPIERLEGNELPVSAFDPAGFTPLGGTAHEKRTVAFAVPEWDAKKCIQCFECSFVCPHAAIRPYIATEQELEGAPETFETVAARNPKMRQMRLRIQNYPEDCVGCGSCAYNCPAPGKALVMKPLAAQIDAQKENLLFAQEHITLKDTLLDKYSVQGSQLRQPLLEFASCCAGCGETPHVKLLTQLFGDRLIIANATGCSSIWGAYEPAMPYCADLKGRGPAWGNSLFEDNAEYGYGIMKGVSIRRKKLESLVENLMDPDKSNAPEKIQTLLEKWTAVKDDGDMSYAAGEAVVEAMRREINRVNATDSASQDSSLFNSYRQILKLSDMFQKKSVWAVGGDGWAFDIDYDGLDEVLASRENINILVLDTEGYSNTGGEMSKATQLGSVNSFALNGKSVPKKRLARMAMQYDYVYTAQVCFGADMNQLITAFKEAETYDGPSLIVALCPCISWGIREGMGTVVGQCKNAVKSGYWTLWRFNPDLIKQGKDPLVIDSPVPANEEEDLRAFLTGQTRFASLAERNPAASKRLQSELAKERATNRRELDSFLKAYAPDDDR